MNKTSILSFRNAIILDRNRLRNIKGGSSVCPVLGEPCSIEFPINCIPDLPLKCIDGIWVEG